jgi:hypothetical protein
MALVKFIENEDRYTGKARITDHLPEQDAFSDETDASSCRGNIVEPDLVADFFAQADVSFVSHARGQHPSR